MPESDTAESTPASGAAEAAGDEPVTALLGNPTDAFLENLASIGVRFPAVPQQQQQAADPPRDLLTGGEREPQQPQAAGNSSAPPPLPPRPPALPQQAPAPAAAPPPTTPTATTMTTTTITAATTTTAEQPRPPEPPEQAPAPPMTTTPEEQHPFVPLVFEGDMETEESGAGNATSAGMDATMSVALDSSPRALGGRAGSSGATPTPTAERASFSMREAFFVSTMMSSPTTAEAAGNAGEEAGEDEELRPRHRSHGRLDAVSAAAAGAAVTRPAPRSPATGRVTGRVAPIDDFLTEGQAQAIIDAADMAAAEAVVAAAEAQEAIDVAAAADPSARSSPATRSPTAASVEGAATAPAAVTIMSPPRRPAVLRRDSAVARTLREIESAEYSVAFSTRVPQDTQVATVRGRPTETGAAAATVPVAGEGGRAGGREAGASAVSEQQEVAAAVAAVAEMEARERLLTGGGANAARRGPGGPIVRGKPGENGVAVTGILRCVLCQSNIERAGCAPDNGNRPYCRNCWRPVCDNCVGRVWAKSMVPPRYTLDSKEHRMRVCKTCNAGMEAFRTALLLGQVEEAMSAYSTGCVNSDRPYAIYHGELPVHCAAAGGNVRLLSWLVDELGCRLFSDPCNKIPNRDKRSLTVLGAAAVNGQVQAMRFLVKEKGCSLLEIKHKPTLKAALDACLHGSSSTTDAERSRYKVDYSTRDSVENRGDGVSNGAPPAVAAATADEEDNNCCIVCFDSEVNCTLVPCGHHCCCVTCASKFNLCPVCRTMVSQKIKAIPV